MIRCTSCGTENEAGAAFCDNCGAQLATPTLSAGSHQPTAMSMPTASERHCPACGEIVLPGEAFCATCGAVLSAPLSESAALLQPFVAQPQSGVTVRQPVARPAVTLRGVKLLIGLTDAEIVLPDRTEVIVGRADAASQFFPDVNLDHFDALANGVSRRHARMLVQGDQILLEDLDAANGTAVNRQRLAPRQSLAIRDGDELRFGTLTATVRLS